MTLLTSHSQAQDSRKAGTEVLPSPPEGYEWVVDPILFDSKVYFQARIRAVPWYKKWTAELASGGIGAIVTLMTLFVNLWMQLKKHKKNAKD